MKELETNPIPAKHGPDPERGGPHWTVRVLWSTGCAVSAIAIGVGLTYIVIGVDEYFHPRLPFEDLSLLGCLLFEIAVATVVGFFAGILFAGRMSLFVTLVAHFAGSLSMSAVMLLLDPAYRIFSPFFFVSAILLGGFAIAVLRSTNEDVKRSSAP